MRGRVDVDLDAILQLRLRGPGKSAHTVIAVIDTGYSGWLTLPPRMISALQLPKVGPGVAELADGTIASFDLYKGAVFWHGRWLPIDIDEATTDPLIGMALLEGCELNIRVKRGGNVTVQPLQ